MGETFRVGGSGMVIKAQWKGTEVAVKTLATKITKQMKKSFVKEVSLTFLSSSLSSEYH